MDLLFVCTGNACRSPLADRLLTAWVQQAAGAVGVASAGTRATSGRPMDDASARALVELGGDPSDFRSRQLDAAAVSRAALVLTMTRAHRRTVLAVAPRALRKTFTLTEAAALLPLADLSGLADQPLAHRAELLAVRLGAARARRQDNDADDIRDPVSLPIEVHRQVAGEIAVALRSVADALLRPEISAAAPVEPDRPRPSADLGPADVESLNAASLGATPDDAEPPRPRPGRRRSPLIAAGLLVLAAATAALLTGPLAELVRPGTTATADLGKPKGAGHLSTASTASPPLIVLPADPALLILGDSATQAVGADPPSAGWACQSAVALGWRTQVQGFAGSGYTTATDINPRTFAERVTELGGSDFVPDVLVLQGGALDAGADPGAVTAGVQATVAAAQAAWPGVQVVVLGIVSPGQVSDDLAAVNAAERLGAEASGVPFIDPLAEGWFSGADGYRFTAADGVSLNNPGHAALAGQFLAAFRSLVRSP